MNEETRNIVQTAAAIELDCFGQYNQAIDDACHALEVSGELEAWKIVRSLREPKMNTGSM